MEILFNTSNLTFREEYDEFDEFIQRKNSLKDLKVDEIRDLFDLISKYMSSKDSGIKDTLIENELGFIIFWLKKSNINKMLNINFEDYSYLDNPKLSLKDDTVIYARPLGNAVHWIAGNVPVLGIISLFQTLITKNKSVVKVPNSFKNVLPDILKDLKDSNFFQGKSKDHLDILLDSIFVIYIDRDDKESQIILSKYADIRIAWGGSEAMENIAELPKRINTRDIIFGPKLSLSYISKDSINKRSELEELCQKITDDVFAFNQAGCNAPHNIILEKGFKYSLDDFSTALGIQFANRAKRSKQEINPMLGFNLLIKKFIYQSNPSNNVYEGEDNQWNIFTSSKIDELESPLFSRNVFVSEIESINSLGKLLPTNVQSIGLKVHENDKLNVIKALSDYGVDRFPEIGKMSIYNHPWDGYLPLQQTIKWISTN
mgnify:CR=1 FL=1